MRYSNRVGFLEDWVPIITDFFTGLFSNLSKDEVPDYPIKSKATLEGIMKSVQANFPNPSTAAEATKLLQNAVAYAKEARDKGGAVNETYAMIYDQVAETLRQYLGSSGTQYPYPSPAPPGGSGGCPAGYYMDEKGTCRSAAPQTKKDNTLLYLGGAAVLFLLMNKKRR